MSQEQTPKQIFYKKTITSPFHIKQITELSREWGVDHKSIIWLMISKGLTAEKERRERKIKNPD